jgi:hypothetical protein
VLPRRLENNLGFGRYDFNTGLNGLKRLSLVQRSYNGLIIAFHPVFTLSSNQNSWWESPTHNIIHHYGRY